MLHNLQNSASINLPHILIMQMLIQFGREVLISHPPFRLIFKQSKGISENLFSEGALILEMFSFDLLLVFLEVFVFNFVLILLSLDMHLSPCIAQFASIVNVRFVCLCQDSCLAGMVQKLQSINHN